MEGKFARMKLLSLALLLIAALEIAGWFVPEKKTGMVLEHNIFYEYATGDVSCGITPDTGTSLHGLSILSPRP